MFEFSVVSYNILAQDLLEQHFDLYGHCDEKHLRWPYRRKNIMHQLNKNSPDVCAFSFCTDSEENALFFLLY